MSSKVEGLLSQHTRWGQSVSHSTKVLCNAFLATLSASRIGGWPLPASSEGDVTFCPFLELKNAAQKLAHQAPDTQMETPLQFLRCVCRSTTLHFASLFCLDRLAPNFEEDLHRVKMELDTWFDLVLVADFGVGFDKPVGAELDLTFQETVGLLLTVTVHCLGFFNSQSCCAGRFWAAELVDHLFNNHGCMCSDDIRQHMRHERSILHSLVPHQWVRDREVQHVQPLPCQITFSPVESADSR